MSMKPRRPLGFLQTHSAMTLPIGLNQSVKCTTAPKAIELVLSDIEPETMTGIRQNPLQDDMLTPAASGRFSWSAAFVRMAGNTDRSWAPSKHE